MTIEKDAEDIIEEFSKILETSAPYFSKTELRKLSFISSHDFLYLCKTQVRDFIKKLIKEVAR